jgi:fatty-acyl-CoA synthase
MSLRCDELDFFYFVDRVGETYCWKGEKVSTAEAL